MEQNKKFLGKIILKELKKLFPNTQTELKHSNKLELLIAIILSAQTTDKQVNKVTQELFKKYKTIDDYLKADITEFEDNIKSLGLYKTKAKNILKTIKIIHTKFNNKIPCSMEKLIKLPGVGRKTANVFLFHACKKNQGIAVDTHVKRLSKLYGLTKHTTPEKIEQDLMQIFPKKSWGEISILLIKYGRKYCPAKKHNHQNCPLVKILRNITAKTQ